MDQEDRDSTLEDFKGHNVPLMIATSVAARGLDVKVRKLFYFSIGHDA
jgi:ATP-dependent RNA helicase DDX46/PRP5